MLMEELRKGVSDTVSVCEMGIDICIEKERLVVTTKYNGIWCRKS